MRTGAGGLRGPSHRPMVAIAPTRDRSRAATRGALVRRSRRDDEPRIDQLAITTIRTLAIDGVQKANSGHPGAPMGMAPDGLRAVDAIPASRAPTRRTGPNRDRFVLSAGHASMLLYSLLHLTGYGLSWTISEQFRQWGSRTPGHPEYGLTPGVEATTGPLGQGFANGVGMAIAERRLAARVQPAGPRDRRPPRLRPSSPMATPGGHRVRGRVPGGASAPRQADLSLGRQPHPARRTDGHGLERGRARALRRVRLAHPARRRRQRHRRDRGGDRGRASRTIGRQPDRRPDAHRLRHPEPAGHPEGARLAARRGRGPPDEAGLRLGSRSAVPAFRTRSATAMRAAVPAGEGLVADWEARF